MNTNIKIGFNYDEAYNHNFIQATIITAEELERLLEENKNKAIISLQGLIVEGDLDLRGITFKGWVKFGDVIFEGAVSFGEAIFSQGVNFGDAIFEKEVDFEEAIFKGWVNFYNARFKGEVNFGYAIFEGEVYLNRATFECEVYFYYATFDGGVDFVEAVLRREKLYEIYKLENNKLMNTQIKIGFYGMRKVWNHQFAKATITGKELRKLFEENKNKAIISLKGLTVEGDLDLRGIKFEGQLDFANAVFNGDVWLGDFRFIAVDPDSFPSPLIVDFVQIYSNAYYDKLIFNCQDATFNGVVYFGKATLQGKPLHEIYKLENERLIKI